MTEQEARNKMEKGFAEVKPIVEQSTQLLMDAYEKGFNIGMDIGLQCRVEMALGHSEVTKKSDQEIIRELEHLFIENDWCCVEDVNADLVARHFVKWQNDRVRVRAYAWLKNQPQIGVADNFIKELCDYITQ